MTPHARSLAFAAAFAALPFSGALADRAPTAEERSRIEAVLQEEGFTAWGQIDFDDDGRDVWEVEDAVAEDGARYDLELDAELAITDRDRDD